jgi:TolA-binding protein
MKISAKTRICFGLLVFMLFIAASFVAEDGLARSLSEDEQLIHVGIGAFRDGFYDIAEKQFSLFLKQFSSHSKASEVSYLLAKTYLLQKKWQEARGALSRIVLDGKGFESMDYALFWMAQAEMKLGNLEASRRWILSLLKDYSKFEWTDYAYYLLGCLDVETNRWTLSEGSFRKVLLQSKREDLVRSASFWIGVISLKQNDYLTAISYLKPFSEERGPSAGPYGKEALWALAEAQFKAGQYEGAKRGYQAFYDRFKQDPLIPYVHWRTGFCDYRAGNLKEAADSFRAFLSQFRDEPLSLYTHYLLGEIFLLQGDHPSSMKSLNQVLQAPQPHFLAGTALLLLHWNNLLSNEREEAHRTYQRLLRLNGAEDEKHLVQWVMGQTSFAEGRVADALPYYFSILNSRFREKALFQIGKGYFLENQFREALTNLDLLLLESPDLRSPDEGLFIRAESLLRLADLSRASETYGKIMALSHRSPWVLMALTQLGMQSLLADEKEKAIEAFTRIVETFSDHPLLCHAAFQLGALHEQRKDFSQASRAYSLVLKSPPSELLAPTYFRIGEVLLHQEKEDRALASFEAALRSAPRNSLWSAMTQLEIGNVQRREGRIEEARKSYRAAHDQTKDEQVRKTARDLLERMESR